MNLNPVSIAFQFLCFTFAVAAGTNDPTHITEDISINCGSRGTSSALNGRKWLGDVHHNLSSMLQIKGSSTASSVIVRKLKPIDHVPHRTARLSRGRFSYAFQLNPGQKFIRLHFNPSQYKGFKGLKDLLNVEAGAFTLLSDFSASLTADALGVSSFIKEFCLNILENQQLNITFFPATSQSYAFINGIEVISVPAGVSYFHGGEIGVQVVGHKSPVHVDHSTALEIVHRVNVKQNSIPSAGDSYDMFPTWAVRQANKINKSTWRVPVDVGFRYLVRIYFSEIEIKILGTADVMFEIVINEMIAQTNIDIVKERSGDNNPRYSDYLVMMRGQRNEGKRDILISIRSYDETVDGKGILEGFQILKLSNNENSLAGTNPLPLVQTTESQTIRTLVSILGLRNVIATITVVVTSLINVSVYMSREMWEANRVEEKNKPSARADRVCRRFSLAEIELATRNFSEALVIGRGGFGKVYEGLIDNGQETVAIKRQKFTSSQGALEFLTEIEMLSELRHVNLVSLIGYCNDHGEMILVYEYMASGTLADHLYKLERGKDSCSPLGWKRRLNICIGAGRGLEYLHTGYRTIHRDIKASNILLDENFVAKVADFGLAKPEDRKKLQSHVTTKVKGTPGYFDPFYLSTCRLTRKSDTYAFGVLLLEVLCERPAVDSKLDEDERILSKWALNKISEGEVNEIVASSLRGEISAHSLKTFVGVTERCLHAKPKNRPTMAQVVVELESALEQQEGRLLPVSSEMAIVSDGMSARNDAIELKMASTDVQNPPPLPEDQNNSKVVNGEFPYRRKGGRKTIMHKPPRLWAWNALWSRVKPFRTNEMLLSEIYEEGIKLAKFDWKTIAHATDHFSDLNKVHHGGFGPVYKAVLPMGLVVAVKRLSPHSGQGHIEFKNEILSLPNLQHRNIIKLLGYCIHREERLLVYEFMENGSLDAYLGDPRRECFDWQVRMKIITGIARAILYLHQDSGQGVIYRNLKPDHILLDSEMSPKLSNFGFAKSLVDDQSEQISRIIGTNGYLPPEYYMHGILSTKLDVFNFGNIVLQIVSGRESIVSPVHEPKFLPAYAWKLWKEGIAFNLIDQSLQDTCPLEEALRCIQVGLICIELEPHDRPNMYHVMKMLEGDEPLVEPKEPWSLTAEGCSSSNRVHTNGTSNLRDTLGRICEAGIKLAKFDWNTIADATNHFSHSNEVGRGGFGAVYKAVLPTRLVVAVKRLSPHSAQGHNEFKNEILSLPNLQHRNIIKLLGYCFHREERLLVYEFMENGSLDNYLGDARRKCLEWQVRLKIITGIAQAILYLHRDSGQRVIYRDLKPSNILLDCEMSPKLSDFGFAMRVEDDHSELVISKVAGTYGYLPPEYSIYGKLSSKSAVFNFGIVVLEIVSGRINRISPGSEPLFLLDYAWELWKEGRVLDLIDQSLQDTFPLEEAVRCIQIGLLCIERDPHDRPSMYHVIKMLDGDEPLVEPKMPWHQNAVGLSSNNVHIGGTSNHDDTLGSGYNTDATFEYDDILER